MSRALLVEAFRKLAAVSDDEAAAIERSMLVRAYPAGTVLLEEGQVSTSAYFVLSGCIRQYSLVGGEERTLGFFTQSQWVISLASMLRQAPAEHSLVCAEDSTVVVGDQTREETLFREHPRLQVVSRLVVEHLLADEQTRLASYVAASPEERYLSLRRDRPGLLERVPLYQVASYVGVRPESLSRIRRRLVKQARIKK